MKGKSMAFQIHINDHYEMSVASNDRGGWVRDPAGCPDTFNGFGGESYVTIHHMTMQNGGASLLVVYAPCDSPLQFAHRELRLQGADRFNLSLVTTAINELLRDVLTYPASLT
jgi:hypothetical protein